MNFLDQNKFTWNLSTLLSSVLSRIANPQHVCRFGSSVEPFIYTFRFHFIISADIIFVLYYMEATLKTLQLASSISNFDIIELWYQDAFNSFECKFSYATEAVQKEFESVIVGHYPHHAREHIISPQVRIFSSAFNFHYYYHYIYFIFYRKYNNSTHISIKTR